MTTDSNDNKGIQRAMEIIQNEQERYSKTTNVLMAEEEASDVSLATFHGFDKEGPVRLAAGHGCGGGAGCGHGGGFGVQNE